MAQEPSPEVGPLTSRQVHLYWWVHGAFYVLLALLSYDPSPQPESFAMTALWTSLLGGIWISASSVSIGGPYRPRRLMSCSARFIGYLLYMHFLFKVGTPLLTIDPVAASVVSVVLVVFFVELSVAVSRRALGHP